MRLSTLHRIPATTREALKLAAAALDGAGDRAGFVGHVNIYTCDACRGHIVTRDLERGVTPFMLRCEATEGCTGTMTSSMYRVFDQNMLEDYQWYRPTEDQQLTDWEREHVSKGGLLLRKREA
jgi:hypothetical protein